MHLAAAIAWYNVSFDLPYRILISMPFSARAYYIQPAVTKSPSHPSGSVCMAVELFLLPTVRNSPPEDMQDPEHSVDSYRQSLKIFLFSQY